ncbi:MAG TPA: BON domain-containing protein [Stellaceae bacterium]|nr:BON domain-containing protein [Stellaceae bacterium]
MISDHQLRRDVLDELEFEPAVNAAHIGVAVSRGIVTLTGFVPSHAQKRAAERTVWRVKGVKAIAEEIEVRLPEDKKTADEEIAGRAVDILKWRVGLPADRIAIKVEKGMVTLSGELDWHYQKTEAVAAIEHLTGVTAVINDIRVRAAVSLARSPGQDRKSTAPQRRTAHGWRKGRPRRPGPCLVRARHRRTRSLGGARRHRGARRNPDRALIPARAAELQRRDRNGGGCSPDAPGCRRRFGVHD